MIVEGTEAPSKYCRYNPKKRISNNEEAYLKREYTKFGNLCKYNKQVNFTPGTDRWITFDHDTLLSWGLKDGKTYRELHYIEDDRLAWQPDNYDGILQLN